MRRRAGSGLTLSHLRRPFLSVVGSVPIRQSFVSTPWCHVRSSGFRWGGVTTGMGTKGCEGKVVGEWVGCSGGEYWGWGWREKGVGLCRKIRTWVIRAASEGWVGLVCSSPRQPRFWVKFKKLIYLFRINDRLTTTTYGPFTCWPRELFCYLFLDCLQVQFSNF